MKGVIVALVIVALLAVGVIGMYNGLATQHEGVMASWAQIENQLQRRYDLIPQLVDTVKGYIKHEEGVFKSIAEARARIGQGGSAGDLANAEGELSSAISRLLMITENYPELKADRQFINLQDEIAGTENRLGVARREYNEKVEQFNGKIRRIPYRFFGYDRFEYFRIDEGARTAPKINFNN